MRAILWRGCCGSALLAAGSVVYMRLAHPVPVPDVWVLHWIRQAPWALNVGLDLSFAGLVLLTWAWWELRERAVGHPDGLTRVRTAAALWALPLVVAPPVFSGDGWSYVASGYLTHLRLSPYLWTPAVLPGPLRSGVSPRWLHAVTPYGPVPLAWGALTGAVTSSPWLLLIGYRVLALIALGIIAWAVPRVARRTGQDPVRASWLVLASPFVITAGIGGMHNDLLTGALMLAALAFAARDRWFLAAVLAGLAASVKVPGALVGIGVVLLAAPYGVSLARRAALAAKVALVLGGTVVGAGTATGVGVGWWRSLSSTAEQHTLLSFPYLVGSSLQAVAGLFDTAEPISVLAATQAAAAGAVLLLAGWLLLRPPQEQRTYAAIGVLLLAMTALSPVAHYWYALWCLPLLGCLALARPHRVALLVGVLVLGLAGPADTGVHVPWLIAVAAALVLTAPLVAWGVAMLAEWQAPRKAGVVDVGPAGGWDHPDGLGRRPGSPEAPGRP